MRVREFSTPMRAEGQPDPGCIDVALVEEDGKVHILLFDNETMILQGWCGVDERGNPSANKDIQERLVVGQKVILPPETEYIR